MNQSELTCNKCGNNNWYMNAFPAGACIYCNKCKKLIKVVDRNERDKLILTKMMEDAESEDKE